MARLPRHRPTPSMVVACIALMVALGGTGYAATVLPKNSVGTAQVKNNSLLRQDFRAGQLQPGPRGLAGPAGPQGPPGPPGPTARWAIVRADGTIAAQSGGIALAGKPSAGAYMLNFGAPITGKLILASSANAGDLGDRGTVSAGPCGGTPDGSNCPIANDANHVRVITRKEGDSVAEDHPFYVTVIG
jgi:hypothetical protein